MTDPWRRARIALAALVLLTIGLRAHAAGDGAGRVESVRLDGDGASTTVVVTLSRPLAYDVRVLGGEPAAQGGGRRLVLDFRNATLAPRATKPIAVTNDVLRQIRTGQFDARTARVVLELAGDVTHAVEASDAPPRVTIALSGPGSGAAPSADTPAAASAPAKSAAIVDPPAKENAAATDAAADPQPAATDRAPEAAKQPVRKIPIRARGRRPYSLMYWR